MSAYALAHLRETHPHQEIPEYLEKIQATLDRSRAGSSNTAAQSTTGRAPGPAISSSSSFQA